MADGKIVQCIGAVVDVEFPRNEMPKVYDALKMVGTNLTLEVQQLLGDGVVRTIALGSSDGLRRGLTVHNTNAGISVPVGRASLRDNRDRGTTEPTKVSVVAPDESLPPGATVDPALCRSAVRLRETIETRTRPNRRRYWSWHPVPTA